MRIDLAGTDSARIRFAVSPVYETVQAVAALREPGAHAVHLPWVGWARPKLAAIDDLDLLMALLSYQLTPGFLLPVPDARMPGIDAELRLVGASSPVRVRRNLDQLTPALPRRTPPRGGLPPLLQDLYDYPSALLPKITAALAAVHETLIVPHWPRIAALLEADIAYRAAALADGAVLAVQHRQVAWVDGELKIRPRRSPENAPTVTVDGHGLVLSPSVFSWPKVAVVTKPVATGVIRYPARGVATVWDSLVEARASMDPTVGAPGSLAAPPDGLPAGGHAGARAADGHEGRSPAVTDPGRSPQPAALSALLGRTRAAMLAALAEPTTTSALAARLDVTAGAVSQHLNVLRDAGLVTTARAGRQVLHVRTSRADALLR